MYDCCVSYGASMQTEVKPKCEFEFGKLNNKARRFADELATRDIFGEDLVGDNFKGLVDLFIAGLSRGDDEFAIKYEVMEASLSHLLGAKEVNRTMLEREYKRLATNRDTLLLGFSVFPARRFDEDKFVAVEVVNATIQQVGTQSVTTIEMECVWGPGFGIKLEKTIPTASRMMEYLAHKLGVKDYSGDPRELVRSRMLVLPMDPYQGNTYNFSKFEVPTYFVRYNEKLVKLRKSACPNNYSHPCIQCPIGYDKCPAGVHPCTFIKADCSGGHPGWFDPYRPYQTVCITCSAKRG